MSTFGILAMFIFIIVVGGMVLMLYNSIGDSFTGKLLMAALLLLIAAEVVLAFIQYPCYVVDGIVFACMGYKWLAKVMFIIALAIVLFIVLLILFKIRNWGQKLTVTPVKVIVCGVLLLTLFAYTELYNGSGSFESYDEFKETKARFELYDRRFWPTKYIKHHSNMHDVDCVAVYPFDVKTAAGQQPFVYKADTRTEIEDDGKLHYYYYPFTWKAYEGSRAVEFTDPTYVAVHTEEDYKVSPTDVSDSDISDTDAAAPAA